MARPTAICLPMPHSYRWDWGYLESEDAGACLANVRAEVGSGSMSSDIGLARQGRHVGTVRGLGRSTTHQTIAVGRQRLIIRQLRASGLLVPWAVRPQSPGHPRRRSWVGTVSDDMFCSNRSQPTWWLVGGGFQSPCELRLHPHGLGSAGDPN